MTTVRLVDAVDVNGQRVPCRCGEYLISSTDDDGREVWECLECLRRTYPNVGGYATEGAPAGTWKVDRCNRCGRPVIWCNTIRPGGRMPVDAQPSPQGFYDLRDVAGQPKAQAVHPDRARLGLRLLHTRHPQTCRELVAS